MIVAFKDPPTGSVEAAQGDGNLPATDTAEDTAQQSTSSGPAVALIIVFIVSLATFTVVLSDRRRRARS